MEKEYRPTEKFWQYIKKVKNDSKYQNEYLPASHFVESANKFLNYQIVELIENENDPPDFFIRLKDSDVSINLEVTIFGIKKIEMYNSFYRIVETMLEPIINKNFHLLPNGTYQFNYFPGDFVEIKNLNIEVPDFRYKISKKDLRIFFEKEIPNWFDSYRNKGTNSLLINNKSGNRIGKINMIKWGEAKKSNFWIWPQNYVRMEEWSETELEKEIQNILKKKEEKYLNIKSIVNDDKNHWWLLISDFHNTMGTSYEGIKFNNVKLTANFFKKVFLIQDILSDNRVIEFNLHEMA